mmetsp:Transcript_67059/g.135183  ORF Transcript_67059/g.135183 Transcript_67059/m.135183 type:complete len:83 (-) Transcript_67059:430-678(-)
MSIKSLMVVTSFGGQLLECFTLSLRCNSKLSPLNFEHAFTLFKSLRRSNTLELPNEPNTVFLLKRINPLYHSWMEIAFFSLF